MTRSRSRIAMTTSLLMCWLTALPALVWAASPSGTPSAPSPKDQIVDQFLEGCVRKPLKAADCDKLRKNAVEILKEDLLRLGSTANRAYLPNILRMFYSDDIELRLAAAHAIGMIGPQDQDVSMLIPLTNDPVPDVRHAVSSMLTQAKGSAISLLKQRAMPMRNGRAVEKGEDPAKFSMPMAPDSIYLFDSSDAAKGRLSYVVRGKSDPAQFFKAKAKKGPYKWEQFREQYRYQLQDEEEALNQAQQTAGKQLENEKPPDPTNMEAFLAHMQKLQSVSMQGNMGRIFFDTYQPNLYGAPTVYVLEERQIGQRTYPTRYAVVYQELAFKLSGYRLAWTTVPDDALKAAQVASLKEQREEEAQQATSRKQEEAAKKREAELESLSKKKDAAEKKQFKKGQEDLEKELGF